MNSPAGRTATWLKRFVAVALVAWAVVSAWYVYEACQTGRALVETLDASWRAGSGPRQGSREKLLAAARSLRDGRFHAAAVSLRPPGPPSDAQRMAAQRFFAEEPDLKRQFIAASAAARLAEDKGSDVGPVREALAHALSAAARRQGGMAMARVVEAEHALDAVVLGGAAPSGQRDEAAVARWAAAIGPAYLLGRDVLAEGHAAVEKLVGRASWHAARREFAEAAPLLNLTASLLNIDASSRAPAAMPEWFTPLAQAAATSATQEDAESAVGLAEAVAASESPGEPVMALVRKARREADAGQFGEARWWAGVALSALGMADQPVAVANDSRAAQGVDGEASR